MKALLLTTALASLAFIAPAHAVLQIAFTDGTTTITCADGQACDLSGGANNIIILNETVGNFHIVGTAAASLSSSGGDNLQFSTSLIQNSGASLGHLGIIVGDNNFAGPITGINESASLTFNSAVGSGASTLNFFADPANGQPAGPGLNIPGTLLFTATGAPATNPDSFSGTNASLFDALGPFSMTETANLVLRGGGSITGFNESMATVNVPIPEPSTWVMLGVGFAALSFAAVRRRSAAA